MDGYSLANSLLAIAAAILAAADPASALLVLAGWMVFSFVLVPMYANQLYYRRLKRLLATNEGKPGAPPVPAGVKAFFVAILSFGIPAFFVMAPAMYADYTPRVRVSESLAMAASLKEAVGVFHAQHRRFPAAHEIEKARLDPGKDGRSLAYDSQQQSIVITMGDRDPSLKGKRFALRAEVRGGEIHWNCRTIDLDRKYLPAACRGD